MRLDYHKHICPECGETTVHHTFRHESVGDTVRAWCRACDADRDMTIGEYVHTE